MRLYEYFRSSASVRVRIALNLKGLTAERQAIGLLADEQSAAPYRAVNPQGLVPALEVAGDIVPQSLAIIEYLDETHPDPPLLPRDPLDRARVRGLAQIVACDIHPVNNLRIRRYLTQTLGHDKATLARWYNRWIAEGFAGFEGLVARDRRTGAFCHGAAPGLADICLFPQVLNAAVYSLDMAPYPTLARIFANCAALPAFDAARPEQQAAAG